MCKSTLTLVLFAINGWLCAIAGPIDNTKIFAEKMKAKFYSSHGNTRGDTLYIYESNKKEKREINGKDTIYFATVFINNNIKRKLCPGASSLQQVNVYLDNVKTEISGVGRNYKRKLLPQRNFHKSDSSIVYLSPKKRKKVVGKIKKVVIYVEDCRLNIKLRRE